MLSFIYPPNTPDYFVHGLISFGKLRTMSALPAGRQANSKSGESGDIMLYEQN
jgi:hypothetical protein